VQPTDDALVEGIRWRVSLLGRTLQRRALGTEATYRVVGVDGDLVKAVVVSAPGLKRGQRITFTVDTAMRMQTVGVNHGGDVVLRATNPQQIS
jgi:tetrahydromethanopterin S-methyltransferase subunit F